MLREKETQNNDEGRSASERTSSENGICPSINPEISIPTLPNTEKTNRNGCNITNNIEKLTEEGNNDNALETCNDLLRCLKPPPSVPETHEDEEPEDEADMSFDDMCEVVLSLKCRYCTFLCQDKGTLTSHVKFNHHHRNQKQTALKNDINTENQVCKIRKTLRDEQQQQPSGSGTREQLLNDNSNQNQNQIKTKINSSDFPSSNFDNFDDFENYGKRVKKLEMPPIPSIPPTPEAFLLDEDENSNNGQCQLTAAESAEIQQNQNQSSNAPQQQQLTLSAPSTLAIEESSSDQVEDVFLCAECDIVFSSKELCCRHMHDVHDLIQFSADFIQEEIISKKNSLQECPMPNRRKTRPPKHLTAEGGAIVPKRYRVSKEMFYTCSKCPSKFESNEVMKFHEQCHVKQQLEIIEDEEETRTSKTSPSTKSKWRFACPVCETQGAERLFLSWSVCSGHLWRDHKIDCELYSCSICKQFKNPLITRVKEHEELHTKESVYVCKTCHRRFKQLKQLRSHEKYHKEKMTKLPPPTESRWYTPKECHICKRILSDAKCLKKHISAVHNKLKPYCCNICGHMTARKAELQLHVRQHTGEKPFKCNICPFVTGDHNSLRKHKLRHSDKRPYACPYCDYRCIQSCAFKKHIVAVHPGQEVVFLCQLCSHASVNEVLFAAHQKDHEEGRLPSEVRNESHSSPDTPEVIDNSSSDSHPTLSLVSMSKIPKKPSWMEEDSNDVIDTGGVTIPASPVPPLEPSMPSPSSSEEEQRIPQLIKNSEIQSVFHVNGNDLNEKENNSTPSSDVDGPIVENTNNTLSNNNSTLAQQNSTLTNNDVSINLVNSNGNTTCVNNGSSFNGNGILEMTKGRDEIEVIEKSSTTSISNTNGSSGIAESEGTLVGCFNLPVTPSAPILHLGQTTYILLPPNTPLPFPNLLPASSSTPTTVSSNVNCNINVNVNINNSNSVSQAVSDSDQIQRNNMLSNISNEHSSARESISYLNGSVGEKLSDLQGMQEKEGESNNRSLSPLLVNSLSSSQLLDNMPQLDALDLAEVMDSCNQGSGEESNSMFERFLGISGGM